MIAHNSMHSEHLESKPLTVHRHSLALLVDRVCGHMPELTGLSALDLWHHLLPPNILLLRPFLSLRCFSPTQRLKQLREEKILLWNDSACSRPWKSLLTSYKGLGWGTAPFLSLSTPFYFFALPSPLLLLAYLFSSTSWNGDKVSGTV